MVFPSKWLEFSAQKELRRLRNDITDKTELKTQIAASFIVAVLTIVLEKYITDCIGVLAFCICIAVIIALIFLLPYFLRLISNLHKGTMIIDGKTAKSIFDDEIIYYVLTSAEYQNYKNSHPRLSNATTDFYNIESKYYLEKAIHLLARFSANNFAIIGDGDCQIPYNRIENIVDMIVEINEAANLKLEENKDFDNAISISKHNIMHK